LEEKLPRTTAMSLGSEAEKLGYRWEIDPPRIKRSVPEEYNNMKFRRMNCVLESAVFEDLQQKYAQFSVSVGIMCPPPSALRRAPIRMNGKVTAGVATFPAESWKS
jgi:hypothetical protein